MCILLSLFFFLQSSTRFSVVDVSVGCGCVYLVSFVLTRLDSTLVSCVLEIGRRIGRKKTEEEGGRRRDGRTQEKSKIWLRLTIIPFVFAMFKDIEFSVRVMCCACQERFKRHQNFE